MNKRGELSFIVKTILLFAFLILILVAIFGKEAILNTLGKGFDKIADNTLLGLRQKQGKTEINSFQDTGEAYDGIMSALRKEGGGPCILRYKQLPDNFDSEIIIENTPQGVFIQLKNKNGQIIRRETISGRVPCVIEGQATENFFNDYLDGTECSAICHKDYIESQKMEIKEPEKIIVNGQEKDLEDNNLLFKAKDGNVCFIPTRDGGFSCSVKDGVLDDDCIPLIGSLPECENLEWNKVLQEYKKNRCRVNKYTCKAESLPCQCFSAGRKSAKENPETCSERESYCYDGAYGCDEKGPDYGDDLKKCKETNPNFELAPACIVDSDTCQVKNSPCSCQTAGSKQTGELPYVCLEGQYCYNEQIGCSNEAPSQDKPLYVNYCRNSNKILS